MKEKLTILLAFLANIGFAQQTIIKGNIKNLDGHKVNVIYESQGKRHLDSIETKNGAFELSIAISSIQEIYINPHKYYKNAIALNNSKRYMVAPPLILFVAPGDQISVSGDAMKLYEADVQGGKYEKQFIPFHRQFSPLIGKQFELQMKRYELIGAGDKAGAAKIQSERGEVLAKVSEVSKKFYTGSTENMYAMYKLSKNLGRVQLADLKKIYASYPPAFKKTEIGQEIEQYISQGAQVDQGKAMIDFSGKTLDSSAFNSKNLRGKYVLLDFWGSWCKPCRQSHPHLLKLYEKYKIKGFEIVGIAQENRKDARTPWAKAIKEDGIFWTHLLNNELKKDNDLVKAYQIGAFPTKILIDKDGLIIWRGVGQAGEELDGELKRIFGE